MVIGVLQFELLIHDASSLKDKRRVVQSVKDRLHREHLVSVAEVGAQDTLNAALLAAVVVAADGRRVGEVLDAIDHKLRGLRDGELAATSRSVLHASDLPASRPADPRHDDELRRELLSMMEREGGHR